MESPARFVGIDVSKVRLDVAGHPGGPETPFPQSAEGIAQLVAHLRAMAPTLIVLEATGGLEGPVVRALVEAALPVVVVNPRQVRDFAKATGQLAKTDRLDARALARFAEAVRPALRPLAEGTAQALRARTARRRPRVEMLTAERNRLGVAPPGVHQRIRAHLAWLEAELAREDDELDAAIRRSPVGAAQAELLRSVPGVGPVVSRPWLADLPELGALTRQQIAALVGVAPLNRDSGRFCGRRGVWGGRAAVRAAWSVAALVAIRRNRVIRSGSQRLRGAGKAPKVALVACMRKLLTILNAMVKHHTPWCEGLA